MKRVAMTGLMLLLWYCGAWGAEFSCHEGAWNGCSADCYLCSGDYESVLEDAEKASEVVENTYWRGVFVYVLLGVVLGGVFVRSVYSGARI